MNKPASDTRHVPISRPTQPQAQPERDLEHDHDSRFKANVRNALRAWQSRQRNRSSWWSR